MIKWWYKIAHIDIAIESFDQNEKQFSIFWFKKMHRVHSQVSNPYIFWTKNSLRIEFEVYFIILINENYMIQLHMPKQQPFPR